MKHMSDNKKNKHEKDTDAGKLLPPQRNLLRQPRPQALRHTHHIPRVVNVILLHSSESTVRIIVGGIVKTMFEHLKKAVLDGQILFNHFLGVHPLEAVKHFACVISQGPARSES